MTSESLIIESHDPGEGPTRVLVTVRAWPGSIPGRAESQYSKSLLYNLIGLAAQAWPPVDLSLTDRPGPASPHGGSPSARIPSHYSESVVV